MGAIATWYGSPKIAAPKDYVEWLRAQVQASRKVIIFGNFGAHTADGSTWMENEDLNRFFYPFGVEYKAAYTAESSKLQIAGHDSLVVPPAQLTYYLLFRSINPANQIHLTISRTDLEGSQSALVVTTPFGGMVQETYVDCLDRRKFLQGILSNKVAPTSQRKRLLGLFKSSEKQSARDNHIVKFLEQPLYDLGYEVDFHDIETGFPEAARMQSYAGVLTWFQGPEMKKAGDYAVWLLEQMKKGKKVVIFGNYGAFAEDVPTKAGPVRRFLLIEEYNRFFYPFGLEFRAAWTPDRSQIKVVKKDPAVISWLPPEHVGHYFWIRSVTPSNEVFLSVDRADIQGGEAAVVVATPFGGLALESYILKEVPGQLDPRFHVNLKPFLEAALTTVEKVAQTTVTELERPARPVVPLVQARPSAPADVTPIKRKILAFYQREFEESPFTNAVHLNAESVLNHLGLVVDYRAVEDPLPSPEEMKEYRGVLAWFSGGEMTNARQFDAWIRAQVLAGKKVALVGNYAAGYDSKDLSLVDVAGTFAALGLEFSDLGRAPTLRRPGLSGFKAGALKANIKYQDPTMIGFERPIDTKDPDVKGWPLIHSKAPENKIYLTMTNFEGDSDLVVVTPKGGVALGPTSVYVKPGKPFRLAEVRQMQKGPEAEVVGGAPWRIDPFRFFSEVFETDDLPKPDFTTLNGARIYYAHIDGDSFGGISLVDRSSLNGAVMESRVLDGLGLPITVSYVTKDIERKKDPVYWRELEVARRIFELPNVEPASHTYSHPFDWRKGDLVPRDSGGFDRTDIDIQQELNHSVDFIDRFLTPKDKRCDIILWSGRCNPGEAAVRRTRELGIINMNGGETVYDEKHPFIAGILPVTRQVGNETQYHVSAAGDFYFTGSWTRDYDGMKNLVWYFDHTDSPRRLRAMNVYFHFYLAERQPGIDGLKIAFDHVRAQRPAPMYASEYARVLRDYLNTQVGKRPDGSYWVGNLGDLRTIRIDQDASVNLERSTGVLGYTRHNKSLYISLDDSKEHIIVLGEATPRKPWVSFATHYLDEWKVRADGVDFLLRGQGPAVLTLENLEPKASYRIEAEPNEQSFGQTLQTDARGRLEWNGALTGYKGSYRIKIRKTVK